MQTHPENSALAKEIGLAHLYFAPQPTCNLRHMQKPKLSYFHFRLEEDEQGAAPPSSNTRKQKKPSSQPYFAQLS
jgi:hypothetical protein